MLKGEQIQIQHLLDANPVPTLITRMSDGMVKHVNSPLLNMIGLSHDEVVGSKTPEFFAYPEQRDAIMQELVSKDVVEAQEILARKTDGSNFWALASFRLMEMDGEPSVMATIYDISERKQAETFMQDSNHVLEMMAVGRPQNEVFHALNAMIEKQLSGTRSSVLVLDDAGQHLLCASAPALPDAYNQAVHGIEIGPSVGSCGTAAFRNETVIVSDIAHDPLWEDFKGLALGFGLAACWSMPIHHTSGRVLGTFAVYFDHPCSPSEAELTRIASATHIAGLVIEHGQNEKALSEGEQRLQRVLDAEFDAVIVVQGDKVLFTNKKTREIFHYQNMQVTLGKSPFDYVHPKYRGFTEKVARRCLRTGKPSKHSEILAIKPDDGEIFPVEIACTPIKWNRYPALVVMVRDISERKAAEQAIANAARQFQQVLDADFDAVIVSRHGEVLFSNIAAQKMFGFSSLQSTLGVDLMAFIATPEYQDIAKRVAGHVMKTGRPFGRTEMQGVRPDSGDAFPMEIASHRIDWEGGAALVSVVRDVTEQKEQQKQIRQLQHIIDQAKDPIYANDLDGNFIMLNQASEKLLKCAKDKLIGQPFAPWLTPESLELARDMMARKLCGDIGSSTYELTLVDSEGNHHIMENNSTLVFDEHGKAFAVQGVLRDVAERKEYARKLEASEQRLNCILEASPVPVIISRVADGNICYANPAMIEMIGLSENHFIEQKTPDYFVRPEERAELIKELSRKGSVEGKELRLKKSDGSTFHALCSLRMIDFGNEPSILTSVVDITEQKRAEETIAQSERYFRNMVESNPSPTVITRVHDGKVLFLNQGVRDMFDVGDDTFEGLVSTNYYANPQDRDFIVKQLLEQGSIQNYELQLKRHDGSLFWAMGSGTLMEFDGEKAVMITVTDLSEQRKLIQALERSEARYHGLVDMLPDALLVHQHGRIVFANPSAAALLGEASPEAILGNEVMRYVHEDSRETIVQRISEVLEQGSLVTAVEEHLLKSDGSDLWAEVTGAQVVHKGEAAVMAVLRDVSEQKEAEYRLRQAQKMEAVGTMVGGVAHDFNNMLAGMLGQLFLLKQDLSDKPESLDRIAKVEQQGFRAADMIQQMLTFARKQQTSMQPIALASLLKETLKLHQVAIPENIRFNTPYFDETAVINGDAALIQQIVLNLLSNARDAVIDADMPSITMSLEAVAEQDSCYQVFPDFAGQPLVCLSVTDNGCGIPESIRQVIFEPFFTTKEVGEGTGLGLAMLYGAMKSMHGEVDVASTVGEGSVFRLYFPRIDESVCALESEHLEVVAGDGVGILVVDDEDVLRDVMGETLASIGYRVFLAADGEEALAIFSSHQPDIALAILDVVMPKIGGVEVFRRLREKAPTLPVIFHTGYGQDALVDEVMIQPLVETVTKPVSIEQLAGKVAGLLHENVD